MAELLLNLLAAGIPFVAMVALGILVQERWSKRQPYAIGRRRLAVPSQTEQGANDGGSRCPQGTGLPHAGLSSATGRAFWETPRNVAILLVTVAALSTGLGYWLGRMSSAPLVVQVQVSALTPATPGDEGR